MEQNDPKTNTAVFDHSIVISGGTLGKKK